MRSSIRNSLIVASVLASTLSGLAQESAQNQNESELETITISADSAEGPDFTQPLARTIINHQELQQAQISDTKSLVPHIPNLNFSDFGLSFANTINMRGVGSSSALIAPSVKYYVDGVPLPARMFDMPFGYIEKIEVLRGPQGNNGGLNAQAGAINITTKDPSRHLVRSWGATIGSYGQKQTELSVEGSINQQIRGLFAAKIYDYDGDIRNISWSAPNVVSSNERNLRSRFYGTLNGKLIFETENAGILIISAAWQKDRQRPTTGLWLDNPQYPRNAFNPRPKLESQTAYISAKYEQNLGSADLTTISNLYYYDTKMKADIIDGFIGNAQTNLPGFLFQAPDVNVRRINEDNLQASHEMRLHGLTVNNIEWQVGTMALWSRFQSTTDIVSQSLPNGGYKGITNTTHLAVFGETKIEIFERLNWIMGLRLTNEIKDFDGRFIGHKAARSEFYDHSKENDTFLTGRTGLTFNISDNAIIYSSLARGEKTGGYLFYNQFAAFGVPLSPYKNSTTWTYEAGIKAKNIAGFFDISTAAFYNDIKDEQFFTFNPFFDRVFVENANTHSYGGELESVIHPIDNLKFGLNLALLQTKITSGHSLIRGNEVPYSPKLSTLIYGEYKRDFNLWAQGEAFARLEYSYTGKRMIDPANSRQLDAYGLINLHLGWQNETWEIFGDIENIFNKTYVSSAYQAGQNRMAQPVFAGIPGIGRSFSVGMKVKF